MRFLATVTPIMLFVWGVCPIVARAEEILPNQHFDPLARETPWKPGLKNDVTSPLEGISTASPIPVTGVRTLAICWDVSDSGQVVVGETDPGVAFKWTKGEATIINAYESWAYRINSKHEIVGTRTNAQGYYRGVVWRQSGAIEIGTLDNVIPGNPGRMSWGEDINDASVVAGTSHNLSGTQTGHAVRWTESGGLEDLGTLPSGGGVTYSLSAGYGINNANEVVGTSAGSDASGTVNRTTRWTPGQAPLDIGGLEADRISYAEEINDLGQIVGNSKSTYSSSDWKGFIWDGGVKTNLGNLGYPYTAVEDLNNLGQVVGWSYINGTTRHAFIWESGTMTDLNTYINPSSGWILEGAYGINDHSQIVGWASKNGQQFGFLLCLACCSTTGASLSITAVDSTDSDGDGLFDEWEQCGIDANDDGNVDFYLKGADAEHKDLYVELDAMAGGGVDHSLSAQTLQDVVDAFKNVPNSLLVPPNPNGMGGITLHIVGGQGCDPCVDETIPLAAWSGDPWVSFDAAKASWFGTAAERTDPNSANILQAKKWAYRYCISADSLGSYPGMGLAEVGANDFMVALGEWPNDRRLRAGVFMHELGHTLNLRHGGADVVNDKPNYYSLMNYKWTTPQFWAGKPSPWRLDYSREVYPTLNESALVEADGVGPAVLIGDMWVSGIRNDGSYLTHTVPLGGGSAADWKSNGVTDPGTVAVDLNHMVDSPQDASPGQVLVGYNDWLGISYEFREDADAADGVHLSSTGQELTYQQWLARYNALTSYVGIDEPSDEPESSALLQNDPNPVRSVTRISFVIKTEGQVFISVFDLQGREVRRLFENRLPEGMHEVEWDGRDSRGISVRSGMYLYRLRSADGSWTRKLIVLANE